MTLSEAIEKRLLAGFLVVLAVALLNVFAALRTNSRALDDGQWVNQTYAFLSEADAILSELNAAEAAHANYLITGRLSERTAFRQRAADVSEHIGVARALSANDPLQTKALADLEKEVKTRLDSLEGLLKLSEQTGQEAGAIKQAVVQSLAADSQKKIRDEIAAIKQTENQLLQARDQRASASARQLKYVLYGGVGFNFLLLLFLFGLIQSDLAVRRDHSRTLREYNETLEQRVKERTAELAASNEKLTIENLERLWAAEGAQRQQVYSELIINCIDAGVFVITRHGSITRLNPLGAHMLGYQVEEIVGKSIQTILGKEYAGTSMEDWKNSLFFRAITEDRALVNQLCLLRCRDGSAFPVMLNLRPMKADGKSVGAVVTVFRHNSPVA
jgi:PAS domain S-box-containing protein